MSEGTNFLTLDNINPYIIELQYVARGPLVIRANEIEKEMTRVIIILRTINFILCFYKVKEYFDACVKTREQICHHTNKDY